MNRRERLLTTLVVSSLLGVGVSVMPVYASVSVGLTGGAMESVDASEFAELSGSAYTQSGSGNSLTVVDSSVTGSVYGGHSEAESADSNVVSVSGGSAGNVWGGKSGSYEASYGSYTVTGGSANGNDVTINNGAVVQQKVVGGEAAAKSANENRVTIQGAVIGGAGQSAYDKAEVHPTSEKIGSDLIAGGVSSDGDTNQNVVRVSDTAIKSKHLAIFGGLSDASAKGNEVTLSLATAGDTQLILTGGSAINGTAEGNIVDVTDTGSGTFQSIVGGTSWAHPDDLTEQPDGDDPTYGSLNNQVHLQGVHVAPLVGSTFSSGVYAGYSFWGKVEGNSASIEDSTVSSVSGGYSMMGSTSGNRVTLSSSQVKDTTGNTEDGTAGLVFGGLSVNGRAADDNQVILAKGTQAQGVYGGLGQMGTAKGNSVTITDSSVETEAVGGQTGDMVGGVMFPEQPKDAENNQVTVNGSSTIGTVVGGEAAVINTFDEEWNEVALSGKAVGNTVTVNGGTIKNSVLGGHSAMSAATGNTVTIAGGTIGTETASTGEADDNAIAGGFAENGVAADNTVNITGGTLGSMLSLYGGYTTDKTKSTGNTLNVYTQGHTVKNLDYFQNLNFYVPETAKGGDTLVTVTGTADVTGAAITAGVEERTQLSPGQVIKVIYDGKGIASDGATYSMMSGKNSVTDAGFVTHTVDIKKQDANTIVLYIPENKSVINPDTKLIPEQREAAINSLVNASDLAASNGFASAVAAWDEDHSIGKKFTPYVVLGGHDLRYETGSYVDDMGFNSELGFVRRSFHDDYADTVMPFLEYGNGNYTAHLDDGARADGNQRYIGAGILVRRDKKSGLHYEGMVRAGRLDGDFRGTIGKYAATYDTTSPYIAAHVGVGKVKTYGNKDFDWYGKFFWTHLGSDSVLVHSELGDSRYHFDDVNSYRTRLGLRWTKHQSDSRSYYAGLGWDYEFDGEARAQYQVFDTPSPSVHGSSGFLELGWQSKITKEEPWGADVKLTGWAGKQRGVTYSATVTRAF